MADDTTPVTTPAEPGAPPAEAPPSPAPTTPKKRDSTQGGTKENAERLDRLQQQHEELAGTVHELQKQLQANGQLLQEYIERVKPLLPAGEKPPAAPDSEPSMSAGMRAVVWSTIAILGIAIGGFLWWLGSFTAQ